MKSTFTAGMLATASLSLFIVPAALRAGQAPPFTGVSLNVSHEVAPPDGIAQVKMTITEPRPISTGGLRFQSFGWDVVGVAAISPANDSYGVAQIDNGQIRFAIESPTGSFGTDPDYPVFTVALRVPAAAPLGTVVPVGLGGDAPRFISPDGTVYPTDIKDGSITVNGGISIDNVVPGSADLPAGSVVTIVGRGFRPSTRIRFGETILSAVRYVDSTRIQVVLAAAARMHGMRIRAENRDGTKTTYFSYQRTSRQGTSAFPALQHAVPLFPIRLATRARITIAGVATGIALQNLNTAPALVALELLSPQGAVLAATMTAVEPNRFRVREVSELFGINYGASDAVRVVSTVPIQAMGISVNPSGDASPIVPR
jgi:hypothetical protein